MSKLIKLIKKLLSIEFIRYIIGGGSITALNFVLYVLLIYCFGVVYHVANLIAIVVTKIYGYFINKLFVYQSKNKNLTQTAAEGFRYFLSRSFTGVLDYVLVLLLVEFLNLNKIAVKIFVMIVVIIINYFLGKFYVFGKKKNQDI